MNIIYAGNPLLILSQVNTPKKAGVRAAAAPAMSDMIALSQAPDKALVKYLEAVDNIASDLLRILDDYAATGIPVGEPFFPNGLPRFRAAAGDDTYIYFPAEGPGGKEAGRGQVIVIRNNLFLSDGSPVPGDEEALQSFVMEVGSRLSAAAPGIGLKVADIETVPVRDRFILLSGARDITPVIPVILREAPGGPGQTDKVLVREGDIHDIIKKIKAFIDEQANVEQVDVPLEKSLSANDNPLEFGTDKSPVPAETETIPVHGPVKIVKEILSSIFSQHTDGTTTIKNAEDGGGVRTGVTRGPAVPGGGLWDALPGITVRYVDASPLSPDIPAGTTDSRPLIVDKLVSFKEMIEIAPEPALLPEGTSEEDLTVVREARRSVHEQMPALVRQALHAASRNYEASGGAADQGIFGIGLDEKGNLRIDPAVLVESLADKKEKTITFIRDFAASLQDRLRYDFNPLAGAFAGGRDTASITGAGKKGNAGDDSDEQKTRFEERLNKVQLLLRSSYELKDQLTQALSLSAAGGIDETDQ